MHFLYEFTGYNVLQNKALLSNSLSLPVHWRGEEEERIRGEDKRGGL